MRFWRTSQVCLIAAAVSVGLVGCGGGKVGPQGDPMEAKKMAQLSDVHDLVAAFVKRHNQQAPKQASDLTKDDKISPGAVTAIKDGSIVIVYGVPTSDDSTAVLAYEKDADKNGGFALLASGEVKKMAAGEIKTGGKK
jgi:hypothetical protein